MIRMKPTIALLVIKQYERPDYGFDYMSDEQKDKAYEYRKAVETIETVIDTYHLCESRACS